LAQINPSSQLAHELGLV